MQRNYSNTQTRLDELSYRSDGVKFFTLNDMEHYLNFSLVSEPHRFHVLLPYSNLHALSFETFDTHLQGTMPTAFYERTRKFKLSSHEPETESIEFHRWFRQQKST